MSNGERPVMGNVKQLKEQVTALQEQIKLLKVKADAYDRIVERSKLDRAEVDRRAFGEPKADK